MFRFRDSGWNLKQATSPYLIPKVNSPVVYGALLGTVPGSYMLQALIKTNRFRYPRKHLSSEETLYNACLRVEYIDEELSVKGQVLLISKES